MYPLKFENLYYEKVWGGREFEKFRDNMPDGLIGETWDVACHEHGMSIVSNGEFKGITLEELVQNYGMQIIGRSIKGEYPLLVKLINSSQNLSVQVHPGDDYAKRIEDSNGKTEFWYVIDAKKGARLALGTHDCTKEVFENAIREGKTEEFINFMEVKKGDCFLIQSGMVHAICDGIVIVEIQQNSDITYRIYDYGRPRELHIDKALDVINFELKPENLKYSDEKVKKRVICDTDYFGIEKLIVKDMIKESSNVERFDILTCVDGEGYIKYNLSDDLYISLGDSVLIPACLGEYSIEGDLTILKTYPK